MYLSQSMNLARKQVILSQGTTAISVWKKVTNFQRPQLNDIILADFQGNIPKETPQSKFESETELKLENFILEGLWFRFGQNLTASPC